MGTKEIQKLVQKTCVLKGHPIVCPNISISGQKWECDVLSITDAGLVYEYEVKVSRSDFKADKKKAKKHEHYAEAANPTMWLHKSVIIPHYMIYVVPEGLVRPEEVPAFAGLWYAKDEEIVVVKTPEKLHEKQLNVESIKRRAFRMYMEREALGCTRLTYENKLIKQRNEEIERQRQENYRKIMERANQLRENKKPTTQPCQE